MARSTARVLALLEILQGGGTHPVPSLVTRLGVDERTVRRYVEQLVDLGVPVESVRGRNGGYRLAPGYRMPPLMLTDDEALAMLLGLVIGGRSGALPAGPEVVEAAAAKLRRVLPRRTAERLEALLESADLALLLPPARAGSATDIRTLMLLAEAARDRRPVAVSYTRRDGEPSRRTILPYGIVARSGRWYLTGHESKTGQVRTFRLDRIRDPVPLPGSFNVPAGFDVTATVLSALAATPWRHTVSVRVAGEVEQVRAQLPVGMAACEQISPEPEGVVWTRVRLRAERLDWVAVLFAGLGRAFVVEEPAELREQLRTLAARLLDGCAEHE